MRIGSKLLLSFLTVALLVLITGSISYYFSNEIKNDLIQESRATSDQLQTLTEMSVQLQNSLLYTRNYLTESAKRRAGDQSLSVAAQVRQSRQTVLNNLESFSNELKDLSENRELNFASDQNLNMDDAKIISLTDSLDQSYRYYQTLVRELFELDEMEAMTEEVFNITIEPYFRNTLLPILLELRSAYESSVDAKLNNLQLRAEDTVRTIVFYTILAFIISLLLAYLVYRSISRPIKILTLTAQELGDGNLSKRIELNTKDELAHLADTFNKMAENLSKSMVSRTYVNNIIQSMGDMLFVTNSEGEIELVNHAVSEKLEYDPKIIIKTSFWNLLPGEERQQIKDLVIRGEGMESPVETQFVLQSGKIIPVNLSYTVLPTGNKEINRIFVASDISLLKDAEQKISESLKEKNVMLAEIHHRVKNNLAVISGLLEMQIWDLDNDEVIHMLRDSQLRIQSIALVHEKLYQTENFANVQISDYIHQLVKGITDSFNDPNKNIQTSIDCDDISMSITQAIPFSLLLNEGVVNAYKHAFEGQDDGVIKISLKKEMNSLRLIIQDDGVGISDKKSDPDSSLGMRLVETLTKQLDGENDLRISSEGGTVFEVIFSLV